MHFQILNLERGSRKLLKGGQVVLVTETHRKVKTGEKEAVMFFFFPGCRCLTCHPSPNHPSPSSPCIPHLQTTSTFPEQRGAGWGP